MIPWIWKVLEKTCQGENLTAVKQSKQDAEKMKQAIQQRMSTINKYSSRTKLVIKIGKDKYSN